MKLDPTACYLAILSRDRRFDGQFMTGITTTGIYCRPICPVRPAKFENMRFYTCAAAAEAHGFRPCRRCRPELAPGMPDQASNSPILASALRLISQGLLDGGKVEDLAREVGLSERQLRRLFIEHLSAPPTSIARRRRVEFAMQLLEQSELSIIQTAFAAGYQSVREFNHCFRRAFRVAPREIRRRGRASCDGGGVTLKLPYRPPFDWQALLRFLGAHSTPSCEAISDASYVRSIRINESVGVVRVFDDPVAHSLILNVQTDSYQSLLAVVERVRQVFDLRADPRAVSLRLHEGRPAPALRRYEGLRVPGVWDGFEFLVRVIAGETLTTLPDETVLRRLVHRFGEPISPAHDRVTHLFPDPAVLARTTVGQLEDLGLSRIQANSVQALARAAANRSTLESREIGRLVGAAGEYVAMRLLREPDAFPAGEPILRSRIGPNIDVSEAEVWAESWRPWRAYGAIHLLQGSRQARASGTASPRTTQVN